MRKTARRADCLRTSTPAVSGRCKWRKTVWARTDTSKGPVLQTRSLLGSSVHENAASNSLTLEMSWETAPKEASLGAESNGSAEV
jgi:hypothetical protein